MRAMPLPVFAPAANVLALIGRAMDLFTRPRLSSRMMAAQAGQFAFAALGGGLFHLAGIPAGWLSGALVATTILVALRRSVALPPLASEGAILMAGISLGTGATPEAIATIGRYPLSLAMLALAVIAITALSAAYLRSRPHWTNEEALLAATPGALSTVIAIAVDRRARLGPIVVVQMFRLLALILIVPSAINAYESMAGQGAAGRNVSDPVSMSYPTVLVIAATGAIVGMLLRRLRVPAPMLLGAMIVSVVAHATGLVEGGLPPHALIFALILFGIFVGARMRNITAAQIRSAMPEALVVLLIGSVVAAIFAALVTVILAVPFEVAFVAFAPGGLEALVLLSIALGLDPLYVGAHHLARIIMLSLVLPILLRQRSVEDD